MNSFSFLICYAYPTSRQYGEDSYIDREIVNQCGLLVCFRELDRAQRAAQVVKRFELHRWLWTMVGFYPRIRMLVMIVPSIRATTRKFSETDPAAP